MTVRNGNKPMTVSTNVKNGDEVILREEDDSVVPAGKHIVTKVNDNGSFHVGGRTAVWPERIISID